MCAEIEVAQAEPRPFRVERRNLLGGAEGLAAPSPSAFPIEGITEPIRDRVRIRRYVQSMHDDVVGDVDDHGEVGAGHHARQPAQELSRADSTRQRRYLHNGLRVVGSPTMADGTDATTAAVRRRALARADAGKSLSLDELTALLTAEGESLETLLAIAARQRDLGWGETVTYSRKVFV